MAKLTREQYINLHGPTRGDLVRLADTSLLAEVERDYTTYGDELSTGAGKCMRDGEGFEPTGTYASGALDMVVQNATIIDAVQGIVKADIGVRDGRIAGIGKAGNPNIMDGVDPRLRCGPNTTVVHADGFLVTAGGIEAHAHFISPQQCWHALAGGMTTMIGMTPGPHFDVSCSGPNILGRLIQGAEEFPLNFGFLGRGCMDPGAVEESVAGGALGVKIHEDYGASPAVLEGSLVAADRNDFSVHIHTDTINEFGFCEDTLATIGQRTVHMYHTEGSGGGHAPDLIRVNGMPNALPSSTNPTNPFTPAGLDEGLPMTMLAHFLNFGVPEDVAFAEMRVRPQTMAAEDLLHDMGAISIFATDTQGMGKVEEVSIPAHLVGPAIWTPIGVEGIAQTMMLGDGYGVSRQDLYVTSMMDKLHGWQLRANELSETTKLLTVLGVYIKKFHGCHYYGKAVNLSRRVTEAYDASLADYDLLLMPTMPMKSQPLPAPDCSREEYVQRALEMIGNTCPFDITHHPAMTLPCGMVDCLPIGAMLIGKHYDEATIYRAAYAFEQAGDWKKM